MFKILLNVSKIQNILTFMDISQNILQYTIYSLSVGFLMFSFCYFFQQFLCSNKQMFFVMFEL